jgi:hypothetical protein
MEIVRQIKETCCHVAYNPQKEEEAKSSPAQRSYELPDGSRIEVCPVSTTTTPHLRSWVQRPTEHLRSFSSLISLGARAEVDIHLSAPHFPVLLLAPLPSQVFTTASSRLS